MEARKSTQELMEYLGGNKNVEIRKRIAKGS